MTLQLNGDPSMCWSANLADILYSPGAVGRKLTLTVPSLLSWQDISALLGPSTASANPPAPAPLVLMTKPAGSPQMPCANPSP